jgi:hypothetical protein
MARPGVTYQEVADIATQLIGQGKHPTVELVRITLGTGSSTTIANHLRQWKANQESNSLLSTKENIPSELVAVMKGLWEKVLTQSQEKIITVENSYQKTIAELQQELEKYKNNNQRWQKLFNQWQEEKNELASDKLTLEQALEFAHKENQSLHGKNDGLLQQLQEKQERVEELHRLHQQTQANLEHYRDAAREQRLLDQQQFEREKQHLQLDIKNSKEQLVLQQSKLSEFNQKNQLLEQSYIELRNQYKQSASLVESLKNKAEQLEKINIEHQQTRHHWQHQFNSQQKSFEAKLCEVVSLQSDNKILNQQLFDTKQLLRDAQDQNKLLASEKWELSQENASLKGQLKQLQKIATA